jgi:hypothetical protein
VLDLEGRVAREREGIGLGIEQVPKAALHRVLFEGLLDLADLDCGKEMRERVAVAPAQALERAGNLVAFAWRDLFPVERQDDLNPFQPPGFIAGRFQELQGTESEALIVAGDRVMGAACGGGQGIQTHPFVEHKNGNVPIPAELGDDQCEHRAFAGAGWPEHHRVPKVTDVQIQTKRRVAFGDALHQGWSERRIHWTRGLFFPGPDRARWDQVRKVKDRDIRTPDVLDAVARQTSNEGVHRV